MKVVAKDNFDRDHVSEYFVNNDEFMDERVANAFASELNSKAWDKYYAVVPDDYKLYKAEY